MRQRLTRTAPAFAAIILSTLLVLPDPLPAGALGTLLAVVCGLIVAIPLGLYLRAADRFPLRTAEQLRTRRYRAWVGLANRPWALAIAAAAALLAASILAPGPAQTFTEPGRIMLAVLVWWAAALLAARLFRRRHSHLLPDRPRSARAEALWQPVARLGHRSHLLVIPLCAAMIGLLIADPHWSFRSPLQTGLVLIVYGLLYAGIRHGGGLCETCVTEWRVDSPGHAAHHERRFRIYHRSLGYLLPTMLVVMVGTALLGQSLAGHLLSAAIYVALPVLELLSWFHVNYQPWCPVCGGGDDGPKETVPDPSGGHGRPVPAIH